MHDGVFGRAQEVGRPAQAVQHSRAKHAGGVGVGVNVDFHGRVHSNNSQSADDLRRVRDLLRTEEEFRMVVFPLDHCQFEGIALRRSLLGLTPS